MKERTLYYCDYCGTAYASKIDAIECEKFHKTPKRIIRKDCVFKPKKVGPAWPYRIRVKDDLGNTCSYIYDGREGEE